MLGQIVGAQIELQNAIAELTRSGGSADALTQQIAALSILQQSVGNANLATLASMRSEIASTVASSQMLIQQARTPGETTPANAAERAAAAAAREILTAIAADYYDKKLLDPYLRFDSARDEADYRKRERDNEKAYDREKAKGTIDGDHNAAAIMERQLLDAGAHGADASPDYTSMLDRARGAKADLKDAKDVGAERATEISPSLNRAGLPGNELDDVLAALKAAGVTAEAQPEQEITHGLNDAGRGPRDLATPGRA